MCLGVYYALILPAEKVARLNIFGMITRRNENIGFIVLFNSKRCVVNKSWRKSIIIERYLNFFVSHSFVWKIICTFASHLKKMPVLIKFGALDERFSLWSAKPAKAVRLRHAPHKRKRWISWFNAFFLLVSENFYDILRKKKCNALQI